eukprot:1160181_1
MVYSQKISCHESHCIIDSNHITVQDKQIIGNLPNVTSLHVICEQGCENANVLCPAGAGSLCKIDCNGTFACRSMAIRSVGTETLRVNCLGLYSCDSTSINATSRDNINITSGNVSILIHCEDQSCHQQTVDAFDAHDLTYTITHHPSYDSHGANQFEAPSVNCPKMSCNIHCGDNTELLPHTVVDNDFVYGSLNISNCFENSLFADYRHMFLCTNGEAVDSFATVLIWHGIDEAESVVRQFDVGRDSVAECQSECIQDPNLCCPFLTEWVTCAPIIAPTPNPSALTPYPSNDPSTHPTILTTHPSTHPTTLTTLPSSDPSNDPSTHPSPLTTNNPTNNPSINPTEAPVSLFPTSSPTTAPTLTPSKSPTKNPTSLPTYNPTSSPSQSPTHNPTNNPTNHPTYNPTLFPSQAPIHNPTNNPTNNPTYNPTFSPSQAPTHNPTNNPTNNPTYNPT